MKRVLRVLLMVVVAVLAAVRTDAGSIARGKYLAEHVALCVECHGEDLGGATIYDNRAMGRITSANLTTGQGGGTYSDDDFARAIRARRQA